MAYVCRSLQTGLPALRFAVIRRAFGALLLELGSEPARVVFVAVVLLCDSYMALKTHARAAWTFPIRPLSLAV